MPERTRRPEPDRERRPGPGPDEDQFDPYEDIDDIIDDEQEFDDKRDNEGQ